MEMQTITRPGTIDTEIALQRLNGDRALLASLASFFLEDAPQLVTALHDSIDTNSLPQVVRTAHSLCGLASTFEAKSVTNLTAEIERQARQGETSELAELMHQLDAEFASLIVELQVLVATPGESGLTPVD